VFLKISGAAEMVGVAVGNKDGFDLCGIKPQFLKTGKELRVQLIGPERIDHHQAVGRADDVGGSAGVTDGVHVIEDLGRFDDGVIRSVGPRSFAKVVLGRGPLGTGNFLGLCDVLLHSWSVGFERDGFGLLRGGSDGQKR
jgi:hypothetical protein